LKHRDLEVIDGVLAAQVALYEAYYAIERGAPLTAAQRKILQLLNLARKAAGEAPIMRPGWRRGKPALRLIRGGGSRG
jgi:hypothetical protein